MATGIGVDDIFVIVQSWDTVGGPKQDHKSVEEKISAALRHAGVSVLVTSVTDICAFGIGSSTVSNLVIFESFYKKNYRKIILKCICVKNLLIISKILENLFSKNISSFKLHK